MSPNHRSRAAHDHLAQLLHHGHHSGHGRLVECVRRSVERYRNRALVQRDRNVDGLGASGADCAGDGLDKAEQALKGGHGGRGDVQSEWADGYGSIGVAGDGQRNVEGDLGRGRCQQ